MESRSLYLLDAFALIYRAYYALINQPRFTHDGKNTSAVFGFVNSLEEVLRKQSPSHIAVCFDPPGPTFRHEADPTYKAERQEMPEDIRVAIPIIKEIVKAYRIPVVEVPGYEADDVIGTLATQGAEKGYTVYMMTPDKDFGQLVTPSILQYKPSFRGKDFELRGEKEVCERYGIQNTHQVIDLLALMGDKVDNIPGCPGVGEKTAVKLIAQFGSVENMLDNTDRIKGALRKKVEENADSIRHSKFMATIRTDVPTDISVDDLESRRPDTSHLFAIFRSLEFRTLADRVEKRLRTQQKEARDSLFAEEGSLFSEADFSMSEKDNTDNAQPEEEAIKELEQEWILVDNPEAVNRMDMASAEAKECGITLLAYGEGDMDALYRAAAVAVPEGENFVIPATEKEGTALLLDILSRDDIRKVTAAAKRDYVLAHRLRGDDRPALRNYYDTSLAHYLLQPEQRHEPERLAETYLRISIAPPIAEPKPRERERFMRTSLSETEQKRLCHEARTALLLAAPLQKQILADGMEKLLEEMELPLARVLAEMEITGVRIDTEALRTAAAHLEERIAETEKEIFRYAGEEFNVASPSKVGEILFGRLQLDPKAKKTKTGQYSTADTVLEAIADRHPIVNLIRTHRQLRKLVNTWLTALPESINPATGKVHTNYNQTVTATGRISSSNPNLQNIPVRDELGREIRRAFIADPGCTFLSADYSQIELRLVADFSGDPVMTAAFNNGDDIHAITAAKIYHVPLEEVTAEQRRHAKTANFGILYGISAFGLSQRLGLSRSDAKMIIDGYNATFPTVHAYMQNTIELARRQGYVSTASGRRRMQPDINSSNATVRGYAERNAINAPIQGSAADVIKTAMVSIFAEMERRGLRSRMIMQVHDELNFNVAPGEEELMKKLVPELMAAAYHGNVRLDAACGIGPDWLTAH